MSQSTPSFNNDATEPADPTSLPLFTGDSDMGSPARPGRIRSNFSMGHGAPREPTHLHAVGSDDADGMMPAAGASPTHEPDGIDWGLVAAFRSQASDQLSAAMGEDHTLTETDQAQLGRAIIIELLQSEVAEAVSAGREAWSLEQQQAMADAVFNALFGLGRFQPLLDDEMVENIEVYGYDNVLLEYSDGRIVDAPPVAESDEELIEFLGFLGSKYGAGRPFSEAQPRLHMRLGKTARLAAMGWVVPRPTVVIRRHGIRDTDVHQLVETGAVSPLQAALLDAAVKARLNIVITGAQGAGKTTTLRGCCASIDPWEKIGTFETEYELFLDELPHRHKRVLAFESRPGSGEVGINGRQAGEITLDDLLHDSFRLILSRTIVGEVRGREITAMIKAMQSSSGSLSTTHAASARDALRKLITCAMEGGAQNTESYAVAAVTGHVDLVVHMHLQTTRETQTGGRRKRWISEIISVEPGEQAMGYATQTVFRPRPNGPGVANVLPERIRDALVEQGFDALAFEAECAEHGGPVEFK